MSRDKKIPMSWIASSGLLINQQSIDIDQLFDRITFTYRTPGG
jgi:hypothetical protein